MRKLIAVAMLFAASAALAAPVSLTEENWNFAWDIVYSSSDSFSCTENNIQDTGGNPALNRPPLDFHQSLCGSSYVSTSNHYQSETFSAENTFSFVAQSNIAAAVNIDNDNSEDSYAFITQEHNYYFLEFLVTEQVLFTGNLLLTDVPRLDSFPWSMPGDRVFGSGSILDPGTYWFYGGSIEASINTNPPPGFESIFVAAGRGEFSSSAFEKSIDMTFTSVVPIPAAVWLFGSCLGLLGWIRRRQAA